MPQEPSSHHQFHGDIHTVNQFGHVEHLHMHATPAEEEMAMPEPANEGPVVQSYWKGRERALAECAAAVRAGRRLSVWGPQGMGTTAMAAMLTDELRADFPDGQYFVDLGEHGRTVEAMHWLLLRLGTKPSQIPAGIDAMISRYRDITRKRRFLVVVDGATRVADVDAFQPAAKESGYAVFGTVPLRSPIIGVEHELGPLAPEDAAAYLREQCPNLSDETVRALVAEFGAVTAELCGLASLVRTRSLDSLVGVRDVIGGASVFDPLFAGLSPDAKWLYRLLEVLPDREFESSLMRIFLGSKGWETGAVPPELTELVEAHFVIEHREGWYRVDSTAMRDRELPQPNDPVSIGFVTTRDRSLEWHIGRAQMADRIIMERRARFAPKWFRTYDGSEFPDRSTAMEWFRTLHASLADAVRIAADRGRIEESWSLAEALWAYYTNAANHAEAVECYRKARDAAANPVAEAQLSALLGLSLIKFGALEKAEEALDRGLRVATEHQGDPELGPKCARLMGIVTEQFARLRLRERELDEADYFAERSIATAERIGERRAVGISRRVLAEIRLAQGDRKAAALEWRRAVEEFVSVEDVLNRSGAELDLAFLRLDDGDGSVGPDIVRIAEELRPEGFWQLAAETFERLAERLAGEGHREALAKARDLYEAHRAYFDADRVRRELESD